MADDLRPCVSMRARVKAFGVEVGVHQQHPLWARAMFLVVGNVYVLYGWLVVVVVAVVVVVIAAAAAGGA